MSLRRLKRHQTPVVPAWIMYQPAKVEIMKLSLKRLAWPEIWRRNIVFISKAAVWESQCLRLFGPTLLQSLQLCEKWHVQPHQQPLALAKPNTPCALPPRRKGKSKNNMLSHRSNALGFSQLCRHGVKQYLPCWLDHLGTTSVCVLSKHFLRRAKSLCQCAAAFWAKEIALERSVLWTTRSWKTAGASLGWPLPQSHLVQNIACWSMQQMPGNILVLSLLWKTAGCHSVQPEMGAEMKKPVVFFDHVVLPPSCKPQGQGFFHLCFDIIRCQNSMVGVLEHLNDHGQTQIRLAFLQVLARRFDNSLGKMRQNRF